MNEPPQVLARGDGVHGEVALRRRCDVYELIVNGVFVMDTAETSTERLLADVLLDRHPAPRHVLVAGLGLGVTLGTLLADLRVARVDVIEVEPLVVDWLRAGLVPTAAALLTDPRVHVRVCDVRAALPDAGAGTYSGFLLDVDNGPDFLVHAENAAVYQPPVLREAARVLAPSGLLAVWSAAPSSSLASTMAEEVGPCEEVVRTVERDGRPMTYYIYLARRRA